MIIVYFKSIFDFLNCVGILFYLGTQGRRYGVNYKFPDHFLQVSLYQNDNRINHPFTKGNIETCFCPSIRSASRYVDEK